MSGTNEIPQSHQFAVIYLASSRSVSSAIFHTVRSAEVEIYKTEPEAAFSMGTTEVSQCPQIERVNSAFLHGTLP